MFGFLIGTACLFGLISTVRRARYGYAYGHPGFGGGCGGRGFARWDADFDGGGFRGGHGGPGPWGRHGFGRGGFGGRGGPGSWGGREGLRRDPFGALRYAFRVLDTTPGQEKVLAEAARELWDRGRTAKSDVRAARRGFADALRGESFDEVSLGEATAKLEEATETMRKAIFDALGKAHGVLDDRQRRILADFIESGPRGFAGPFAYDDGVDGGGRREGWRDDRRDDRRDDGRYDRRDDRRDAWRARGASGEGTGEAGPTGSSEPSGSTGPTGGDERGGA